MGNRRSKEEAKKKKERIRRLKHGMRLKLPPNKVIKNKKAYKRKKKVDWDE